MSHSKKYLDFWRCGVVDVGAGLLSLLFPVILLQNFFHAFCYLFLLNTFSTLYIIRITKKNHSLFATPLNNFEDSRYEKAVLRKSELKEFSASKLITILACSNIIYYILCVLFGAPLFESYTSTLYFSTFMTMLTICPLLWYFFCCDSQFAVIRIFTDTKFDNVTENHLYYFTLFPIVGAWFGAFPIPLDWDRPWQAWPITCCIGASLGYTVAQFFMAYKMFYVVNKSERKMASNRSV